MDSPTRSLSDSPRINRIVHDPVLEIQPISTKLTRMWANAQRDGRPAEYRWRPLFNAAKFGCRPLLEYRAVTLPRRETR